VPSCSPERNRRVRYQATWPRGRRTEAHVGARQMDQLGPRPWVSRALRGVTGISHWEIAARIGSVRWTNLVHPLPGQLGCVLKPDETAGGASPAGTCFTP
jgi:hypothetical protein